MNKRKSQNGSDGPKDAKIKKTGGHWSTGLLDSISDPKYFVESDDLVNVIKDKYPKAKHHFLIIPKENILNLKQVNSKHSTLLKHMEDIALKIIKAKEYENIKFKLGYHAQPSMTRLHLHVISEDMISDCLKTKKHWNSFTTDFFLKSADVRENLEKNKRVLLPSKEICKKYMDMPLKCHKCDVKPKNIPELKRHILTHFK